MGQLAEDALSQESAILKILEDQNFKNPKKLKKFIDKIYPETKSNIQRTLLQDIYRSRDPIKTMYEFIDIIRDCAVVIKDLIDSGNHGMVMIGLNVYPVKLDTVEKWLKEGKPWDPEQERLIQIQAAEGWMKEHNRGYFYGTVTLFPNFGFSGVPNLVELKCGTDVSKLRQYPGTNYFY